MSTERASMPPRMSPWRVVRHFLPSISGCLLWLAAMALLATAGVLAGLMSLAVVNDEGEANPGVALFLLSVLAIPVVALLSIAAVAASSRPGARALLLATTSGVLALGAYSCGHGMVALDTPPGPAWMWSVATYGSGATIAAAGALALLAFTPHWVRQSLVEDRGGYVRQSILDRGSVAVSELASGLGLADEQVQETVVDLVADGELNARIDDRAGRVLTVDHLSRQQERLARLIVDRGRERIVVLAGTLGEPTGIVEGWVDELRIAGVVDATVDRGRELVIWAPLGTREPGLELELRSCTGCGGPLRAVGGGLFRCVYCSAELEIGGA